MTAGQRMAARGWRSRGARPWSYRAHRRSRRFSARRSCGASHGRKSSTGRASCGRRRRHKKTPPAKSVKPAGGENPIAHRARYTIYIIAYSCPPCKPKNADAARRFQLR
nr:MAG TPA: hypothetical protein [Caudoviricetes sp.]